MSKIADSYIAISNLLEEIDAPAQVSLAHEELFDVYKEVGEAVTTFSEDFSSGGDPIKVTQSYTSVISKFPDAFLGVATLLRAYGVKFRDSEPGSVFTLSL